MYIHILMEIRISHRSDKSLERILLGEKGRRPYQQAGGGFRVGKIWG